MAETAPSPATGASFADWLQGVRQEAAGQGISQQTLDAALAGLEPDQKVLDLDRSQPEFTITFAQYAAKTVTRQRIDQGRNLLDQYRPLLEKISQAYGVQPQYIVALWAIESDYGRFTGGYSVIGSLATLAYGSSRQEMFRSELIDALTILQQKNITPEAMTGSWAGAMGQCQFMPSSYLKYAVDYTGDGRRDIWTNEADVFASIANYLASNGWRADQGWGRPVRLPPGPCGARWPHGAGLAHHLQLQGHHEVESLDLFRHLGGTARRWHCRRLGRLYQLVYTFAAKRAPTNG